MSERTAYLFARPSFIEGVARIFDFSGSLNVYNESPSGQEADRQALENDWRAVGDDLRAAMRIFNKELEALVTKG